MGRSRRELKEVWRIEGIRKVAEAGYASRYPFRYSCNRKKVVKSFGKKKRKRVECWMVVV
jgi:hypothetical protein